LKAINERNVERRINLTDKTSFLAVEYTLNGDNVGLTEVIRELTENSRFDG